MTRNTTIAIDIDGVIYDIIGHITDEYLPPKFKGYRPKNWNCWEELEITKEEFFRLYSKAWNRARLDLIIAGKYTNNFAPKLFETLYKDGYRISVITKRSKNDIVNTVEYLNEFRFHYDTFTTITDSEDKLSERFNVIIDDNPENLPYEKPDDWYNIKQGILISQEWNKDYKLKPGQFRINNLEEAIPLIHSLHPPLLI